MFEISGTVKLVMDEQTFGSGFTKREFVLTTGDGRFPQDLKFECVKDKIAQLGAVQPGDTVKVSFDLRGREWKGNYYVNLNAWKITKDSAGGAAPVDEDGPPLPDEPGETVDEDVPF